ncbi:MAG: M23 family metallopeptidase [Algoriphagus sp.]|uniref:M23 family metallopeptidase n=1 Tax=Algoriphagus sp. TaxID=1872435 RepID=UPI00184B954D|nr:M23 family metallopeptidase [Algoriphagus sp.]NVJ86675.1 M23 family metallopeptidase [Algoriphagus sp.]
MKKSHTMNGDSLTIKLDNPLMCPIRIWLSSDHPTIKPMVDPLSPILLEEKKDTTLVFSDLKGFKDDISYHIVMGDPEKEIVQLPIELPFPKNKTYKIIQGNNSNYTHNSDFSQYAIDFNLKVKDTVTSVSDGYVVGVIDQYRHGGKEEKWRPFGNFITIYNPDSGLFFQYVHLTHQGSFVQVGDQIKIGQPIGLAGMTGQTDVAHLHFNSLIPIKGRDGIKSHPVEFKEGYNGQALKKGDRVKK